METSLSHPWRPCPHCLKRLCSRFSAILSTEMVGQMLSARRSLKTCTSSLPMVRLNTTSVIAALPARLAICIESKKHSHVSGRCPLQSAQRCFADNHVTCCCCSVCHHWPGQRPDFAALTSFRHHSSGASCLARQGQDSHPGGCCHHLDQADQRCPEG